MDLLKNNPFEISLEYICDSVNNYNINKNNIIEIVGAPASGKTTLYNKLKDKYKCRDELINEWLEIDLFNEKKFSNFEIQLKIIVDLLFDVDDYKFVCSHYVATYAHTKYKYNNNLLNENEYNFLKYNIFDKLIINNHNCLFLVCDDPSVYITRMNERNKDYDFKNRHPNYINEINDIILNQLKKKNISYRVINCDDDISNILEKVTTLIN